MRVRVRVRLGLTLTLALTLALTLILTPNTSQARIELPEDAWDDWFSWEEEDVEWRRVPEPEPEPPPPPG